MPRTPDVYSCTFCPLNNESLTGTRAIHKFFLPRNLLVDAPSSFRIILYAVCLLLLFTFHNLLANTYAQGATATLNGTVYDQAGAVLPEVNIAVISIAQGFQRTTTTNDEGIFVVSLLLPGNYTVKAQREGFTAVELRDVILNVNDQTTIKISLKVGELAGQTVHVIDNPSLIDESPTVWTTAQDFTGSLPDRNTFGGTNSLVSVDALEEFRIQTSTFAPEFGRSPGGQISMTTRPGTNDFHGTLFDYFRNDVFGANALFPNSFVFLALIPIFIRLTESERIPQYLHSQVQKTRTFYMTHVLRYLTLAGLLCSVAWLASEPKWESVVTLIVSLAAFLGLDLHETKKSRDLLSEATQVVNQFVAQQGLSDHLVYLLRHMAQLAGGTSPTRFAKVLAEWQFKDKGQTYADLPVQAKAGWDKAAEYACDLLVFCGLVRQLGSEVIISQLGREMIQREAIRADFPEAISMPLLPGF